MFNAHSSPASPIRPPRSTIISTWTLLLCPTHAVRSQGGPSGVTVSAGPLALTVGSSGVSLDLNSTAPNATMVSGGDVRQYRIP